MDMTRGWLSITLACAFGALIGTLTALEIATRFEYGSNLWVIGAFVGGIAAYVAIDFRHFCAGVAHSYRRTIAWRPDLLWWKALAAMASGVATMYCSIVGASGAVCAYFSDTPMSFAISALYLMFALSVFGALFSCLLVSASTSGAIDVADREWRLRNTIAIGWTMILYCNPISAVLGSFRGMKWVAVRTPSAIARAVSATISSVRYTASTIAQFVAGIFVYVHSQRRTICFVDATIGAAIGYSFGSAIIGAVAGALLGVLNYEIVSVRLLQLVPSSR
ncbi:MAG: hypothetical protein AAB343_02080 [Patescibacteria group bacterium]